MTTEVRGEETAGSTGRLRRARRSPVLLTFLLAPVLGELLSSSMPIPEFLPGWLPMAVLYGSGALLVRELAVRWKAGWIGIVLLGMAYGIYEEAIVVRSFFDPAWQDLDALATYGRSGGVNWLWSELLTFFHAAVPIASTVLIAHVVHPAHRDRPWLRRRGLVWSTLGLAIWAPIGALGFMEATGAQLAGAASVMGLLALGAFLVRPPVLAPGERPAARPVWFFLAGLTGTAIAFLGIYGPAGASVSNPDGVPDWFATGIAVAVALAAVVGWVAVISGRFATWDDRHRVALVWGILAFLAFLTSFAGGPFGPAVALATMVLMGRLHRTARLRVIGGAR